MIDPRVANSDYVVEADDFALRTLSKQFADSGHTWNDRDHNCYILTLGQIGDRPIVLTCRWVTIDSLLILFYTCNSQVADWAMIEKWLKENCKKTAVHTDAQNFHLPPATP